MPNDSHMPISTAPAREHLVINPSVLYVGTPVALITSANLDGSTNITPMSSAWALFDRVILGLTATSQGCANLSPGQELVINFPSADLWAHVEGIARATGRDPVPPHKEAIGYRFEADKFPLCGLTARPSDLVRPPRLAECPLQFEAVAVASHAPGGDWPDTRPEAFRIIETKVLRVHAHRDIVVPGTNHIDTAAWQPLFYVFRHYFSLGRDLGRTFKAEI